MRTLGSLRECSFLTKLGKLGRLTAGLGLLALTGCIAEPIGTIPGLVDGWTPKDVPVPLGFTKRAGSDWEYLLFSTGPARFRSAGAQYIGEKPIQEIAPWYLAQMRADGWTHESTEDGKNRILTFANSRNERAIIELERTFNRAKDRHQTIVSIRIGPHPTEAKDVEEVLRAVSATPSGRAVGSTGGASSDLAERGEWTTTEAIDDNPADSLETPESASRPASWDAVEGLPRAASASDDPLSEPREAVEETGPPLPPGHDDTPRG